MTEPRPVASLFSPASVAVVGASENPLKWGNWLARGALRGEARRPAYLVNRRAQTLLGRPAYPSLHDLPEVPELVVIVVPVAALHAAVGDALAAGAKAIVAISSGSNAGEGALDAELASHVREAGAVLLGPNCLGVLDSGEQLELIPNPLPAGSIGLISQSGNLALELGLLAAQEGLGFSRFASLGNQADIGAAELVEALAVHPATELIALYIEDFRDGRAFARAAARAVAHGKPVLALAIEDGAATTRAVRSHTGALASDGAAIDAACRVAGVQRVHTPREMIDAAQALLRCHPARGRRIAVLADGGGHGSIASALVARGGFQLPELSARVAASLRAQLPPAAAVSNPVDLAGGAERDPSAFDRITLELLSSGELDAVLITGYFGGYHEYGPEMEAAELRAATRIGDAARTTGRPVVVHTMYPRGPAAAALRSAGVPVYESVERAAAVLSHLAAHGAIRPAAIPELPAPAGPPLTDDGYAGARELLAAAGVPFVEQRTVTSLAEALSAARELGYPVVLKALGALHKSDAGGVVIGISSDAELSRAHADLERRLAPEACSLERMAPLADGIELLIGSRWDARFGPLALAGSGGVHAEVLRDTAVALAPVDASQAEAMLRSLRAAPLLAGARGRPSLDVPAAAEALAALSRAAAAHPELAELEVNPLLLTPAGALALDARVVRATPTQEPKQWSSPTPRSSSRSVIAPSA
jgi:acyl-CoA synthetase (NDP forming)